MDAISEHKSWSINGREIKHFRPSEFACKCGCGTDGMDPFLLISLDLIREKLGKPVRISSARRCAHHNARVGGAPMSYHKRGMAVDIDLTGHDRHEVLEAVNSVMGRAGGRGYYVTFLHIDTGRSREWLGSQNSVKKEELRALWKKS